MSKEAVLKLLTQATDYVSGEGMSERLGVSRAAVWKSIRALREAGYEIEAKTNRGYRLLAAPDTPLPEAIWPLLASQNFCREIIYLDEVDSTNSYLKRLADAGAGHGTVAIAGAQTGGRGRLGRSFVSLPGKGLFFSLLLRPEGGPQSVTTLTAFAAVAAYEALTAVAAVEPKIKWVNDILVGDQKLVGILSEMSMVGEMGQVDYVVIGVGVNVHYRAADFPEELRDRATSLAMLTGEPVSRVKLAAAMIDAFAKMDGARGAQVENYVNKYRTLSATVGREVLVLRGAESRPAFAEGISPDCGLMVRYPDGAEETLYYGETSIRGAAGYI